MWEICRNICPMSNYFVVTKNLSMSAIINTSGIYLMNILHTEKRWQHSPYLQTGHFDEWWQYLGSWEIWDTEHLTLFYTYISPILNYASGLWGYAEHAELQILQNRICRFYLGVNKFTPNPVTKFEMDIMDIEFKRWIEMARYKNRLSNMDKHRFPVKIYKWEKSLKTNGWVKNVRDMLTLCNMI